ncbi:MAG: hypothetical protein M1526_00760 [Candidatus Thermoplasmatota archaeon]|jgi:hypothetical protein|nr:hypothetical protein [Candidatus Thermoplasmatota archaeon]MCW6158197.1 hypothetical protein [Thermoplasmatales archaeon]MDA8054203.1 hypothetical protein [Thermoplasmatales archaeon]
MTLVEQSFIDGPITVDLMARAISNGMSRQSKRMSEQEAYDIAFHVLNFFGYSRYVIDNMLEPEDRDAFYMLEDLGILDTEREETTLFDGREWRIHYWLIRPENVRKLAFNNGTKPEDPIANETMIYDGLPEDIWRMKV